MIVDDLTNQERRKHHQKRHDPDPRQVRRLDKEGRREKSIPHDAVGVPQVPLGAKPLIRHPHQNLDEKRPATKQRVRQPEEREKGEEVSRVDERNDENREGMERRQPIVEQGIREEPVERPIQRRGPPADATNRYDHRNQGEKCQGIRAEANEGIRE
jgi:hypothetical protein